MLQRNRNVLRGQGGITGLETAIILIAFVVVASVFSYTVLSAGIFSSEKGKEAIYEGLDTARSSLELSGSITAQDTDADSDIDTLVFTIANALNGEAIDMTTTSDSDGDRLLSDETSPSHTTVVTYLDKANRLDDIAWTQVQLGRGDDDTLLETGEKFEMTVNIPTSVTLNEYDTFTVEIKPDTGAALIFERTLPGKVDTYLDLK